MTDVVVKLFFPVTIPTALYSVNLNKCPKDSNSGNPDLEYIEALITSECNSCSSPLSNLNGNRHILSKYGGSININQIIIKNSGSVKSNTTKLKYYLSSNTTIEENIDHVLTTETAIPAINANSSKSVGQSIFGSDIGNSITFGYYYIIGKIDGENQITEENENNNTFIIPVRYRENFNSRSGGRLIKDLLFVRNINGQLMNKKTIITNKEEEKQIITTLPKGLYFIEKNGKKSKLYKQN